jgi:hypothetical protein
MEFHCPDLPKTTIKNCLRPASGQSSVEFVGLIPVFILCAAIALQALAIGGTLICAEIAAADASRASQGAQSAPAGRATQQNIDLSKQANSALPRPWRGGATAKVDGKTLKVSVRIPQLLPLPRRYQRISTSGGAA